MDKKLAKSLLLNIGYNLLTLLAPFITAPYLSRALGVEKLGAYTYVQSVGTYFLMFGMLGMQNYGNRMIAGVRDSRPDRSRVFWELCGMQRITGGAALLAYMGYVLLFGTKHHPLGLCVALYVATACWNVDWFCEGMEEFAPIAKRSVVIKSATVILVFALVRSDRDLVKYTLIMSVSYLASAVMLWPFVQKSVDRVHPKINSILSHFKSSFLLFIPAIASSVYQVMDKLMIGTIVGEADLAYYEYAERITQVPLLIFTAMGSVMLSRMSHAFTRDGEQAIDTIACSMDLSFALGASFTFGLASIARELTIVYYGPAFLPSGPILMLLSPIILLFGWNNVIRMQYVVSRDLNHIYIIATIAGALVNLLFNLVLIPRYQAVGATFGTLAAYLSMALVYAFCVRKALPLWQYVKRGLPLVAMGLLMGIAVAMFSKTHAISPRWLLADIAIGGALFSAMYLTYGWTTRGNLASLLAGIIKQKIRR